jgi:hypothetical protein
VFLAAIAAGVIALGLNRASDLGRPGLLSTQHEVIVTLGVGVGIFLVAWLRTVLYRYTRDDEPGALDFSATPAAAEVVASWALLVVLAICFAIAFDGPRRLFTLIPAVAFIVLLIWWRKEYPKYVYPILDAVGLTRGIALTLGAIGILRGLINYRPAHDITTIMLATGGFLLLLGALERMPALQRWSTSDESRLRKLENSVAALTKPPTAPATAPGTTLAATARPKWLVVFVAVARLPPQARAPDQAGAGHVPTRGDAVNEATSKDGDAEGRPASGREPSGEPHVGRLRPSKIKSPAWT